MNQLFLWQIFLIPRVIIKASVTKSTQDSSDTLQQLTLFPSLFVRKMIDCMYILVDIHRVIHTFHRFIHRLQHDSDVYLFQYNHVIGILRTFSHLLLTGSSVYSSIIKMQEKIYLLHFSNLFTNDRLSGICIQSHISYISVQIFIICLRTDHGSIITTQRKRWHIHLNVSLRRYAKHIRTDP